MVTGRFALGLVLVALAAAAAVVVAVANRGQDWRLELLQPARVVVDGEPRSAAGQDLAGSLARGGRIRTPERAAVAATAPGVLALEIAASSELNLSAPPGRWYDRDVGISLRRGRVRLRTGAAFAGAVGEVYTAGGLVRLRAGTIAVRRDTAGTRVCVLEGDVQAGATADALVAVPAGQCLMLSGGASELQALPREQAVGLRRFARRAAPRLEDR
jgi:hypothetical protein